MNPDYLASAASAVEQVLARRYDQRLAGGFARASGEILRLFKWRPELDADGSILWRPAVASQAGATARYRPDGGGFVDLHVGELRERHVDPGQLMAALVCVAARGLAGELPEPSPANRQTAARVIAAVAGQEPSDAEFGRRADDDRTVGPLFQAIDELAAAATIGLRSTAVPGSAEVAA